MTSIVRTSMIEQIKHPLDALSAPPRVPSITTDNSCDAAHKFSKTEEVE